MLANYLCTLSLLQDRPFSSYRSSMMAASCLLVANRLLHQSNNNSVWTTRHIQVTTYIQRDLNDCTSAITQLHLKTFTQDEMTSSVLRRYLNNKDNESFQRRIHELIHTPKLDDDEEEEEEEILDLTLDDIDENDEDMSMDNHR